MAGNISSGIQFGTFRTDGYTTRMFGAASGIDTDRLIDALVEARRIPAVRLETRIETSERKLEALRELQGLVQGLRDAVAGLRNPPGVLGIDRNVFEAKDVFLTGSGPSAPNSLVGASASNRAEPATYELVIERIATANKIASDSIADDATPLADLLNGGNAFSGSFTLGLAGGPTAEITIDGTMDLRDVEAAIDAVADTTGISASILKVADGDYRLVLTAEETGKAIEITPTGGDPVSDMLGLTTGGSTIKNELQAARTARFSLDGVVMERTSNLVDDAIAGVTLNLFAADPDTTINLEVAPSAGAVMEAVQGFVDAYNALRDFVDTHRQISDSGEVAEEAVLFADTALRQITDAVQRELGAAARGGDGSDTLGSIGIRFTEGNRLELDAAALEKALAADPEAVRRVFEFRYTTSSPDLSVYERSNALGDFAFTVDIVDSDGDGVIESATIDGIAADVNGGIIQGRAGTPYEGLTLLWVGQGSTSIDVTVTQGVADRLYNALEAFLDPADGVIAREMEELEQNIQRYETDIAEIDERVERFRNQLIEKFARLESALATMDAMLKQVEATTLAWSGQKR